MSTHEQPENKNPQIDNAAPNGEADRAPIQDGENANGRSEPTIDPQPSADNEPAYNVGKYRPPVNTRFKTGQSGNPTGKRNGSKNEATLLTELLDKEKVTLRENGKSRKITVREAIYRKATQDALKGDLKAARFILERHAAVEAGGAGPGQMTAEEKELIDAYLKRLASERGKEAA